MDATRFDGFAKWFGAATSRRALLRAAAAAVAAGKLGRGSRSAAAQALTPPLPGFSFLPVLPTDPGFEPYQLDRVTAGGPLFAVDLTAPGFLDASLQAAFGSSFRGGYTSTVLQPSADDPKTPDRAVTSLIYDCGSTKRAKAVFDAYTAALISVGGAKPISDIKPIGKEAAILGCNGLCETAIGDPYASGSNTDGVFAVSYRGRILSDVRVRSFDGTAVTGAEARAAGKLVDFRVKAVEQVAVTSGNLRAFAPGPGEEPDGARHVTLSPFAAYNTTPVFSFGGEAPELEAKSFLRAKDGTAIDWAPPLDQDNDARQRQTASAGYSDVIHSSQAFTTAKPYRTDYALVLVHEQYIFPTADLRQAFYDSYRDRQTQDLPSITFTDVNATATQKMFAFEAPYGGDIGTYSGFETYAQIDSPLGFVMFDIALIAVPHDPSLGPPPVDAISNEVGAAVFEMQQAVTQCLLAPESCPATVTIQSNPTTMAG